MERERLLRVGGLLVLGGFGGCVDRDASTDSIVAVHNVVADARLRFFCACNPAREPAALVLYPDGLSWRIELSRGPEDVRACVEEHLGQLGPPWSARQAVVVEFVPERCPVP
jgi:hypothetical protein